MKSFNQEEKNNRATSLWIANSHGNFWLEDNGPHQISLVRNDKPSTFNTTYLVSYISQMVRYSAEELRKENKGFKAALNKSGAKSLSGFLNAINLDRTIQVNNQLLSTNLFPRLDASQIWNYCITLSTRYPRHAITLRGLNTFEHKSLIEELEHYGMIKVVSRKIYCLNPDESIFKKKRPLQQDLKRWKKQEKFRWERLDPDVYKDEILDLYRPLYIEKHSGLNPDYTSEFVSSIANDESKFFEGLLDSDERLKAFHLLVNNGEVLTTPMIGYDMEAPKEDALYRNLNLRLFQVAIERNLKLNLSSGAGKFKKQRGGEPHFEYHLIMAPNLKGRQKLLWKNISRASRRWIEPAMEKMDI